MPGSPGRIHRQGSDGYIGLPIAVLVEQLRVVHAIEMIASQDEVVVGLVLREVPCRFAYRVGGALEPGSAFRGLLSRQDLHEAARERVHAIRAGDMAVERRRVELRENEDPAEVGVQAVADWHVDQPVLPANRHGRLGTVLGEREEAAALAAAEDEREGFPHR